MLVAVIMIMVVVMVAVSMIIVPVVVVPMVVVPMAAVTSVTALPMNFSFEGGVGDESHVLDTILGVEFGEKIVRAGIGEELVDLALRIVEIAEDDRSRRTGFLTSGSNGPIGDRPVLGGGAATGLSPLVLVFDLGLRNALSAHGTFFHDTATANGHFRIELHSAEIIRAIAGVIARLHREETLLLSNRLTTLIVEPVESPDLVRAVVAAVTGSDATVVDHHIETVLVMNGRRDGTDLFTWRVLTVQTADGLGDDLFRVRSGATLEVSVDADPTHFAATDHLILAHDGNVVLRLTGHDAFRASGASRQVDGQRPTELGAIEIRLLPQREGVSDMGEALVEPGILLIGLERTLANDGWKSLLDSGFRNGFVERAIDAVVLGRSQWIGVSGLVERNLRHEIHATGTPDGIDVEAGTICEHAGALASTVADRKRAGSGGPSGHDHDDRVDGAIGGLERDHVSGDQSLLLGEHGSHVDGVVPGQLADGIGKFLHPTDIRETSIVDASVLVDDEFDAIVEGHAVRGTGDGRHRAGRDAGRARGRRGSLFVSVGECLSPEALEGVVISVETSSGGGAKNLVPLGLFVAHDRREHFDHAASALRIIDKRMNQRLDNRDGPVGRRGITPGFQIVDTGNHPFEFGGVGRLIERGSQIDDLVDLGERLGEFEISRCVVDGIAIEDDQCLDRTGVHVLHQSGECLDSGLSACDRSIGDGSSDIAEFLVENRGDCVHLGRLSPTGENDATPTM